MTGNNLDPKPWRIFDPVAMPIFRAMWAWVFTGWDEDRFRDLVRVAGLTEDPRNSRSAQRDLALALRAEKSIVQFEGWTGYAKLDEGIIYHRELAEKMATDLVATWLNRAPAAGERQPVNRMLRAAMLDPEGIESVTLQTLAGWAPIGSMPYLKIVGDMAFQSQQNMHTWTMLVLALGANPCDVGIYLLGGLPVPTVITPENNMDFGIRAEHSLVTGSFGYLTDTCRRMEMLYATGLFRAPDDIWNCVHMAFWDLVSNAVGDGHFIRHTPFSESNTALIWDHESYGKRAEEARDQALALRNLDPAKSPK